MSKRVRVSYEKDRFQNDSRSFPLFASQRLLKRFPYTARQTLFKLN